MKMSKKYSFYKKVSIVLSIALINQIVYPTVALALTSGPSAPEFSSFEPVATTGMVNEFTGDFTYNIPVINIPGPDGSGYSMSLSYHSGENVEGEASWVGYGWTLNPGAINRGKSGFPDDANGDEAKYFNDIPENWTVSAGLNVSASLEAFSIDGILGLSASHMARFNNYRGFSQVSGVNVSVLSGLASLGYSVNDGQGTYSANINPAALLSLYSACSNGFHNKSSKERSKAALDAQRKNKGSDYVKSMMKGKLKSAIGTLSSYNLSDHQEISLPVNISPYEGHSMNFSANIQGTITPLPVGLGLGVSGSLSVQKTKGYNTRVFGYMYSGNAFDVPDGQMDYSVEKESTFNKRDKYLSIPFSSADSYNCTGEGVVGGFRLRSKGVGNFRPNFSISSTEIIQLGAEAMIGLTNGGGGNVSTGSQDITVSGQWDDIDGTQPIYSDYKYSKWNKDDEYFMRFNNDLGGDVKYGNNIQAERAGIKTHNAGLPGKKKGMSTATGVSTSSRLTSYKDQINRSGRSSYITYNTNRDLAEVTGIHHYKAYDKINCVKNQAVRSQIPDGIGEIAIYNEDGHRFLYGLPVYSQKEENTQYLINEEIAAIYHKSRATLKKPIGTYSKTGSTYEKPYATTYLMTEITTPDYVDVNFNGPDESDFGGYTRFVYDQKAGSGSSDWYRWRVPYSGVNYEPGDPVDKKDDKGTVMSGEKQLFFLDSIITKTHFAKFYKSLRSDGCAASSIEQSACGDTLAKGGPMQYKLDSIVLYAKGLSGNKVLQKVCFQYDYSLCKKIPNQSQTNDGKLTLTKVWFEYEGVCNSKITPYEFKYNYPSYSSADYQQYSMFGLAGQNPDYDSYCLDRWGNYQADGIVRKEKMNPWVNQQQMTVDPAAWNLKVIKLPSGGEIHVQYEQKDYLYVQDRRATAMVKLAPVGSTNGNVLVENGNIYTLDLSDYAGDATIDKVKWAGIIKDELFNKSYSNGRVFFKILYSLSDNDNPQVLDGLSDWITGYAPVEDVYEEGGAIKIKIASGCLPQEICKDYVSKTKNGIITANEMGFNDPNPPGVNVAIEMIGQLTGISGHAPAQRCLHTTASNSFFRIPVLKEKKGGGCRVKRILMYDAGVEAGDEALYGTEYIYKDKDGYSSGVASNEPTIGRDENALVTFLEKREDQSWSNKMASGKDMEQFEGPIGESQLPSPSIGYSRVLVKNIHSGKTNSGLKELLFYTYRDYPFDAYYPKLGQKGVSWTDINTELDKHEVPLIVLNVNISNFWLTQGYSFINYNINGQKKAEVTYTYASQGNVTNEELIRGLVNPSNLTKSAEVVYTYFEPGEKIKLYRDVESFAKNLTDNEFDPGVEMETVMESRSVEDITTNGNVEFDVNLGMWGAIPVVYPTFFGSDTYNESKLRTHVITKTVSYPAIQKSVSTYSNGVYQYAENIGFDPYTGKPNVIRNYDVYNGLDLPNSGNHKGWLTTVNVAATSRHNALRQKAVSENSFIGGSTSIISYDNSDTSVTITAAGGSDQCGLTRSMTAGDLIKVNTGSGFKLFNIDSISGGKLYLEYSSMTPGSISSTTVNSIEIIRSAKSNQLNLQAENYVLYGDKYVSTESYLSDLQLICNNVNSLVENNASMINYRPIVCGQELMISGGVYLGMAGFKPMCTPGANGVIEYRVGSASFTADASGSIYLETCSGEKTLLCKPCSSDGRYLVVSSSAKTWSDVWTSINAPAGLNRWESGKKGKWREEGNYVFKREPYHRDYAYNDVSLGKSFGGNTYNGTGAYWVKPFNGIVPSLNDQEWLKLSTVSQYNTNGNPIEEYDILNTFSAVRFGYNNLFPKLIAKNAKNSEIRFVDFECLYTGNKLDDDLTLTIPGNLVSLGHTGSKSYQMNAQETLPVTTSMAFAESTQGVTVKLWAKRFSNGNALNLKGVINYGNTDHEITFSVVSSSGEWVLAECKFDISQLTNIQKSSIYVKVKNNAAATQIIDDIIIRPYEAQVSCFVYDKVRYKPIATFDDSHFALLYQYNSEGKLVRKMKETVKGVKTIQETQYNTPGRSRN